MKRVSILFILNFLVISLMAQEMNDPNAQVREAKNYHGINISNAFEVYLSQGSTEAVAVSALSVSDRDKIKVEVKGGILHIGLDKGWKLTTGKKKFKAYISFKNIDVLQISGACNVMINGVLKAQELAINQSGASDLKGKVEIDKLSVNLSGASDIDLSGTATQLHIDAQGASAFKGFDLMTESCHAEASGASDIKITVNKELSADASGASDVRYRGKGVIREMKSSGSGSISKDGI